MINILSLLADYIQLFTLKMHVQHMNPRQDITPCSLNITQVLRFAGQFQHKRRSFFFLERDAVSSFR